MQHVYLLTGQPGVGKTSLIKQALAASAFRAGGFYTEEVRHQGERVGFDIVTLDGNRGVLARIGLKSSCRVGKYGVDVESLDRVGVAALRTAAQDFGTVVIDEIGKMELCSACFRETVLQIINSKKVLGTIMLRPHPWADDIKKRPEVRVVEVTPQHRQQVLKDVVGWLGGA